MKKILSLILATIMIFALTACTDDNNITNEDLASANEELVDLTVVLDWTPNINHSGLYVAVSEGYFAEEGLTVKIIQPGDNYGLQLVAAGQAEFGISYQEEVTFARANQNIPVVSVAAIIQHNTSCFASPLANNIQTVADFSGKKYGGWGGEVEEALLTYLGESEGFSDPVEIINTGSVDFFAATESSVDFSWIYYGVTGIEAELRDVELNTIYLKDIAPAFDYYTPVLVAEESWLADNDAIARSFMTAVSRGYQFAEENPEQAAKSLLAAAPELSDDLVIAGQVWMAGQYTADADFWGQQKEQVWQDFADWLYERNLLAEPFDGKAAYTNEYLPK